MINAHHPKSRDSKPPLIAANKLVDASELLAQLFDENSKPSLRWIREMQAQRRIPYIKIGHLVRFDVEKVRAALADHCTVEPRTLHRR